MPVRLGLLIADLAVVVQLLDQAWPFATELVRTGERAVTATDGQTVDPKVDEVVGGLKAAFPGPD